MRTAVALALAVAVVGCRKAPSANEPTGSTVYDWVQRSPDGKAEARQWREASGCRVQAVAKPGDTVLWSSSSCVSSGLVFLSRNGEKLLVLDLFPPGAAAQAADWSHVPLAMLWNRGAVSKQYTGAEILAGDRATDMRGTLSWVRGDSYEEARGAARAVADGAQVSVDLVDGRTVTFGFEGAPLPTPPSVSARPKPVAQPDVPSAQPTAGALPDRDEPQAQVARKPEAGALDDDAFYKWEDEAGELHFGQGAQVPARFRKVARPVNATVGVVPLDKVNAPAAPPPQPAQPGQPGAQPAGGKPGGPAPAAAPPANPDNARQPGGAS
jgi:hypothetical protein